MQTESFYMIKTSKWYQNPRKKWNYSNGNLYFFHSQIEYHVICIKIEKGYYCLLIHKSQIMQTKYLSLLLKLQIDVRKYEKRKKACSKYNRLQTSYEFEKKNKLLKCKNQQTKRAKCKAQKKYCQMQSIE